MHERCRGRRRHPAGLAAGEWYGTFSRESQTLPVLDFRESAMRLGLLRKYQGTQLAVLACVLGVR